MGTRQKWVGTIVILAALLVASAGPVQAWRGGHGFRGHGFRGHGFHRGFHGHGFRGHGFRHGFHHGFRGHGFRHGFHHGFRGPRVGIGIGIGVGPFWGSYGGWRPYWPTYAYRPVVVTPPPVIVQPSQQLALQPPPPHYWYYCHNPKGYYPYVQQCPGGWQQVTPTPP